MAASALGCLNEEDPVESVRLDRMHVSDQIELTFGAEH